MLNDGSSFTGRLAIGKLLAGVPGCLGSCRLAQASSHSLQQDGAQHQSIVSFQRFFKKKKAFVFFFFFWFLVFGLFETGFLCLALAFRNSLCRPGWPRAQKSPASAFQVLELKACATTARRLHFFMPVWIVPLHRHKGTCIFHSAEQSRCLYLLYSWWE